MIVLADVKLVMVAVLTLTLTLDETFSDTSQQSPPDSVVESYELDKLDPRERWEQEQINALESAAAAEELMTLEHQERQQRRDTDVDMDSGTE